MRQSMRFPYSYRTSGTKHFGYVDTVLAHRRRRRIATGLPPGLLIAACVPAPAAAAETKLVDMFFPSAEVRDRAQSLTNH